MTEFIQPNLIPALPEIIMLVMICLVLVVDLFLSQEKRWVSLLLSVLTLVLTALVIIAVAPADSISSFGDSFILDQLAVTLKVVVCVVVILLFE